MAQSSEQSKYLHCPRCGARLARDERTGAIAKVATFLFLRGLRCKCGWRGFHFSKTQVRRRKRALRVALFVVVFMVIAAATVRYVVTHTGGSRAPQDDGIREVD